MRLLFIGDIVARPGRTLVKEVLPKLVADNAVDFVIGCADNIAHGRGATYGTLQELMDAGISFFTGGDHAFDQKDFVENDIDKVPYIRPANFPEGTPGRGYALFDLGSHGHLLLVNLLGRVSFNSSTSLLRDPFTLMDDILEKFADIDDKIVLVDFHAEATSEKIAFANYVDGRVDAVVGTHTHVPTCDTRVLPLGTMFVTDVGMTGIEDSVLGVETHIVVDMFLTARKQKFVWATSGTNRFRSVLLDTDAKIIKRIDL